MPPDRGRYESVAAAAAAIGIAGAGAVTSTGAAYGTAGMTATAGAGAGYRAAGIAATAGAGTGYRAAAAGIAAGICHEIREPDPVGIAGVAGITGVAGHKKSSQKISRRRLPPRHLMPKDFFCYSQLSGVLESP